MGKATSLTIPPQAAPPENRPLRFSFKHIDTKHTAFPLSACSGDFLTNFVTALRRYSTFTVEQFADNNNEDHRHTFEFTEELAASWLVDADEELRQELPWQFALCPEQKTPPHSGWRVHGIILEDVFYVVWLDPDHLVFIDGRFHPKVDKS